MAGQRRHVFFRHTGVLSITISSVALPVLIVIFSLRCVLLAAASSSVGPFRLEPGESIPPMEYVSAQGMVSRGLYSASPSVASQEQGNEPPPASSSFSGPASSAVQLVRAAELLSKCGGDMALRDAFGIRGRRPSAALPRRGTASSGQRVKRIGRYKGWQQAGPGRRRGGGLYPLDMLVDVFVAMLCTELHGNLVADFDKEGVSTRDVKGLRRLRESCLHVTDNALRARARMLGRSSSYGTLLKLGKRRLVTDFCKDVAVAITFTGNGKGGVSCCCSAQERCLDQGCSFQPYIDEAMRLVLNLELQCGTGLAFASCAWAKVVGRTRWCARRSSRSGCVWLVQPRTRLVATGVQPLTPQSIDKTAARTRRTMATPPSATPMTLTASPPRLPIPTCCSRVSSRGTVRTFRGILCHPRSPRRRA